MGEEDSPPTFEDMKPELTLHVEAYTGQGAVLHHEEYRFAVSVSHFGRGRKG